MTTIAQRLREIARKLSCTDGTRAEAKHALHEIAAELEAAPAKREDGMPACAVERQLRRMLASRCSIPQMYRDDGEASGCSHGIQFDFMRDDVADLDAKLFKLAKLRWEEERAVHAVDAVPVVDRLPCGHHPSLMLKSAETGADLYCELCDAQSGRRDAEQMEEELRIQLADTKARVAELEGTAREDRLKISGLEADIALRDDRIAELTAERNIMRDNWAAVGTAHEAALRRIADLEARRVSDKDLGRLLDIAAHHFTEGRYGWPSKWTHEKLIQHWRDGKLPVPDVFAAAPSKPEGGE